MTLFAGPLPTLSRGATGSLFPRGFRASPGGHPGDSTVSDIVSDAVSDTASENYDFDWIVIGSGFGGSVSALRLAEKGYRVAILECGRRYRDEDFAESTWNLRRYYWMPKLGLRGIFRMTAFKDVFIVSGSGVGGGSLGYANTLYRARPGLLPGRPVGRARGLGELASRPTTTPPSGCSGSTDYPLEGPADLLLKEYGEEIGVGDTYKHTRVGAFFGEPGKEVADPFFGGEGPPRSGCIGCGSCMVGCRHNAKNTLPKNYLWFAEKLGVEILPERQVTDVRPLRRGRRLRGLRGDQRAIRLMAAQAALDPDRARRDRRRRRPGHESAAPELPRTAARCRGSPPASASWSGPTASRSTPSPRRATSATSPSPSRSARASTPIPTPTSRWSPTGRAPTR